MSTIEPFQSDPPRAIAAPVGRPLGYQRWRGLAFLHWPVPEAALRPLVPAGLTLDTWDGMAWVGVVPFSMEGVRPIRLWPEAVAFRFLETNVRTYVRHQGEPGVWFFSLEAASWLAVQGARIGWGLPYHHARMARSTVDGEERYTTRRRRGGAHLALAWRVTEPLGPSLPGSREHFFLERYLLFCQHRGHLWRGQVHHPPYPVWGAEVTHCEESLLAAAGLPPAQGLPVLAHASPGVDVDIHALRRLPEKS